MISNSPHLFDHENGCISMPPKVAINKRKSWVELEDLKDFLEYYGLEKNKDNIKMLANCKF